MSDNIRFEWDAAKAEVNLRKHGISFELAVQVFTDPMHVSDHDRIEGGEFRWQTIGMVEAVRIIVVAHTWREDDGTEVIRIISARAAERAERRRYEQ